jgi:glycosyltransferase involved in cell wall biosynthesis
MKKLGIFATHPIQYYVPLWRDLAKRPDLDVTVHYFSDHSVRGGMDKDFNQPVAWDVDLLKGYKSVFISRDADLSKPMSVKIPNVRELLEKGGFDCVFIQGYTHGYELQILREAGRLGIQVVMRGEFTDRRHANPLKAWVRKNYLNWFYRKVAIFCVIGENARRHLSNQGVGENRMVHSPYVVDTGLLEAQKKKFKRAPARKALGLVDKDFVLLFSGKLIPRKEPLLLIEAIAKLKNPRVKLVIVGDGPLKDEVLKEAEKAIPGQLVFQGFVNQSQLGRYYRAADVFTHPSNSETWGLVVNEAMQFGMPSIVSDGTGCRLDLVKPGSTGFIFPKGNADVLAFHLKTMVEDRKWTREMGENAEKLVALYTLKQAADGIYHAVQLALKKKI